MFMNTNKFILLAMFVFAAKGCVAGADMNLAKTTCKAIVKEVKHRTGKSPAKVERKLAKILELLNALDPDTRALVVEKLRGKIATCEKTPVLLFGLTQKEVEANTLYRKMKAELFKYVLGDTLALVSYGKIQDVAFNSGKLQTLKTVKAKQKAAKKFYKNIMHTAKLQPADLKNTLKFAVAKLQEKIEACKHEEGALKNDAYRAMKKQQLESFYVALLQIVAALA